MLRYTAHFLSALLLLSLASCHKGEINLLTRQVDAHTTDELSGIAFAGDSIGYICGGSKYGIGLITRTTDGGKTWSSSDSILGDGLNAIALFSPQEALIGSFFGNILSSADSLHTFSLQQVSRQPVNYLSFSGRRRGVAVCGLAYRPGSVYNTSDGGSTWARTYDDSLHSFTGAVYIDDSTVIACGFGTILRSADGGASYRVVRENGDFYQAVKFVNSTTGYIVGYQGEILKTTDRGIAWQTISPANGLFSSPNYLLGVDFFDEDNGYAVGESGLMVHTSNGGRDWQTVRAFTSARLRAVHMFSATSGIVAGGEGKVYLFQQ